MLKICFVTAEMAPLAKSGGLADVSGALVKYLHAAGHDIRLFMPAHGVIRREGLDLHPVAFLQDMKVRIGTEEHVFGVLTALLPGTQARIYLIDYPPFFDRPSIYGSGPDEHRRFLLLTHAALLCCQRMAFAPQILHCNDWHTAMGPLWLHTIYRWDRLFAQTRSVFTIHNIGYQGVIDAGAAAEVLPAADRSHLHQDELRAGRINLLRHGLLYADLVTTVSPTYAREIQGSEYGLGLEDTLRARRDAVVGILNGVDYDEWDPRRDPFLPRHFGANQLGIKASLQQELQQRVGLVAGERRPLIGMISRMAVQKGFDLLFDALPALLRAHDFNLLVLGSGEARYEDFFAGLQRAYPGRVHFHRGYSEELAHWIEAAADMFLMPSRYEPCGLNQLYSLRYGTVPIVRRTGGLADSVQPFDIATGTGTGVVFNNYDTPAVVWAVSHALDLFRNRGAWRRLVQNGMAQDFSWHRQARLYVEQYQKLLLP